MSILDKILKEYFTSHPIFWRNRHLVNKNWFHGSFNDWDSPRRKLYQNLVLEEDIDSVFEFGCASGPNLYGILKYTPCKRVIGYDISKPSISYGLERFSEQFDNSRYFLSTKINKSMFKNQIVGLAIFDRVLCQMSNDLVRSHFDQYSKFYQRVLVEEFLGKTKFSHHNIWVHDIDSIMYSNGFELVWSRDSTMPPTMGLETEAKLSYYKKS